MCASNTIKTFSNRSFLPQTWKYQTNQFLHYKSPDQRRAIRQDKPLNRTPRTLTRAPHSKIVLGDELPTTSTIPGQGRYYPETKPRRNIKPQKPAQKSEDHTPIIATNDEDSMNPPTMRTKKSKYKLRENLQPKRFLNFLIYEITVARTALHITITAPQWTNNKKPVKENDNEIPPKRWKNDAPWKNTVSSSVTDNQRC